MKIFKFQSLLVVYECKLLVVNILLTCAVLTVLSAHVMPLGEHPQGCACITTTMTFPFADETVWLLERLNSHLLTMTLK